jgi:ADP-ribosylglycohydrolase
MYGSIIGDICGSIYEFDNYKTEKPEEIELINQKCYYTDDTVLTIAIADAILSDKDYERTLLKWGRKYNNGYGKSFREWLKKDTPKPYKSWGNGSAMRVGPVGWAFDTLEETLLEAEKSAAVTHSHKEGIKGAKAVAVAIYLARNNEVKENIKKYIENEFHYNLNDEIKKIRQHYKFNESCQGTVPEAITAFLESDSFVNSIKIAISIGGDTDTLCCITGSISEAFYKHIPASIIDFANTKITDDMKKIINDFYNRHLIKFGMNYRNRIIDISI